MARSVDDVALFLSVSAGVRSSIGQGRLPPPRPSVCASPCGAASPSDATLCLIEAAARRVERGATLRPLKLPAGFERLIGAHKTVMAYEAASALAYERLFRHAALSPALAASLDDGAAIDAARYDVAREDAKRIRAAVAITMAKLDAVLAPAAAWSRRHRRSRILPALDAAAAALSHPTGRVRAARHADRRPVGRRARAAMLVCSRSPASSRRPCHEEG